MLILIYLKPCKIEVKQASYVNRSLKETKQSKQSVSLHTILYFNGSLLNTYFYLSNGKYFLELGN